MYLFKISEYEPDWLDKQCNRVFTAMNDLSLKQRLIITEQMMEYLRLEEADVKNHDMV